MKGLCRAVLIGAFLASTTLFAATHAPSTLYAPRVETPKPGSLYPRALQLRHAGKLNGLMLATFEEYVKGTPSFPIYRSTDGGVSWSPYSRVADTQNGWGMRFQPFLYELPQALGSMPAGTVLCLGNSIPNDLSQTRLELYQSRDHGATWTFVSHIAQGGAANPDGKHDPVWEPFALLANQKLIVFYSDERDPNHNQKIVHQTSKDGTNWSNIIDDVALAPEQRPGMPIVSKMGNGKYIMSWECVCDGTTYAAIKTTSNPEHWNASDTGTRISNTGGTPFIVWLPSGGLNGTLILSSAGSDSLAVNQSYGRPGSPWKRIASAVATGYSRSFIVLSDDETLFEVSPVGQPSGYNNIVYGTLTIDPYKRTSP